MTVTPVHVAGPVSVINATDVVRGKSGPVPVISKLASPALMLKAASLPTQAIADTSNAIGAVPGHPVALVTVFPPLSVIEPKQVLFS